MELKRPHLEPLVLDVITLEDTDGGIEVNGNSYWDEGFMSVSDTEIPRIQEWLEERATLVREAS